MQESNDTAEVRDSFQETTPRKTAEHSVRHRDGGVGSVVANHLGGGEGSVVITTLILMTIIFHMKLAHPVAAQFSFCSCSRTDP